MVRSYVRVRQTVKPAAHPHEFPIGTHLSKVLVVNALGPHVSRAHNT